MKKIIAVVALAIMALILSPLGATAAALIGSPEIKDQSVQSVDIAAGGVGASEVRNGSLTGTDMNPNTVKRFLAGEKALQENDAQDARLDDLEAQEPAYSASDLTTVTTIGGTFGKFPEPRATQIDSFELAAGKYVVTTEGFFINNAATSGQTRMQIAVRVDDETDWGQDLGTCFTGAISPLANRESHCSTTRVVELAEDSSVIVYGFGYADDQGSADSGKVDVKTYLTATPA